jgi:alpha-ribazole phosphatase
LPVTTKLFLVRHGETIWNKELKYQGHSDTPLSEEGLRQAELVAGRLAGEKIDAVYASDLSRAMITAATIAGRHGLQVDAMADLREIKFGQWEGLTYDRIVDGWSNEMSRLYTHADEVRIPGGETFRELKDRAAGAISRLVEKHRGQTIAVVSHGGTIRTILCSLLDIHLNHVWDIRQDNTAVNIIEFYEHRTLVTLVNDVHHLKTGS